MVNPEKTYALIVGIEKYDKGSSWNLKGPCSDALKFAQWLLKRNVPVDNIFTYISELSEPNQFQDNNDLRYLWDEKQKATREHIFRAITKTLPQKKNKGDLLYLFWGGHGVTVSRKDRRLFYDDGQQNLNLESLLKSLISDIFGSFNQQILIIDACANYYSKKQPSLPKEEYSYGTRMYPREQVVLLATREGYKTKNLDAENTGLFSKVLFNELDKENELLSPQQIDNTIKNVQSVFKQEYYNQPQPIYLWYANANGNEPPKIALNKSAKDFDVLQQRWESLIPIINNINWQDLSNYTYQFLSQYSDDPRGNYPDLSNNDNYDDSLKSILLEISPHQNQECSVPLVIHFAQFLSQQDCLSSLHNSLNNWINQTTQNLGINLNTLNQSNQKGSQKIFIEGFPYLLILVELNTEVESKSQFDLKLSTELHFLENHHSQETKVDLTASQSVLIKEKDIYSKLYELIQQNVKQLIIYRNENELTVELFLPREYFVSFSPEIKQIPIDESNPDWFGSKYKLILRSYDRFNNHDYHRDLLNKWQCWSSLTNQESCFDLDTFQNNSYCLKEIDKKYNWKKFRRNAVKLVNLNINFPLFTENYRCHIQEFLISIWRCGIPFAFWLRGNSLQHLKLKENEEITNFEFEDILTVNNLRNPELLFESIRIIRENAYVEDEEKQPEYLGYHLGFLFDNPYRLPSKFNLDLAGDTLVFNQ